MIQIESFFSLVQIIVCRMCAVIKCYTPYVIESIWSCRSLCLSHCAAVGVAHGCHRLDLVGVRLIEHWRKLLELAITRYESLRANLD